MSIYKKILELQKAVVKINKDGEGYGYKYVQGCDLLKNIKPKMNELGLILKQEITSVETENISYKTSKGISKNEILYKIWFKFTWLDCETGEKDENIFFSSGMNDFDKGPGSAMTYAERYFLMKYFHIETDVDDPDARKPIKDQPIKDQKNHQEDKEYIKIWNKNMTPEERLEIGKKYPTKYGKVQTDPTYLPKEAREEIVSRFKDKKPVQQQEEKNDMKEKIVLINKIFEDYWKDITVEQRMRIGNTFKDKNGNPKLNTSLFSQVEKTEILRRVKKIS